MPQIARSGNAGYPSAFHDGDAIAQRLEQRTAVRHKEHGEHRFHDVVLWTRRRAR